MVAAASSRLNALTGLRFLAAFAIVVHHSRDTFIPAPLIAGLPLGNAVSFFFVLSGFILAYVYPELPSRRDVVHFYMARFARIWPVHIFALLLLLVLLPGPRDTGVLATLANIFLIHAWVPLLEFFFSYNSVSWSISTELGFYLLFPLLIWRFESTWPLKLIGAAACAIAAIWICATFNVPNFSYTYSGATNFGILYFNPLARIFEFTLGMCGALLWRKVSPHLGSNIVVWTAVEIAAIGAFVYYWKFKLGYVYSLAQHGPFPVSIEWVMHANFAPLFLIIILVMASGAGAFARVLGTAPMVFLGEISYSVYMLHQILIGWYSKHMPFFSAVPGLVRFLVFMAVLLLLCAGTYFWIEKPARNGVALMYSRRPQLKPA